MVIPETQYTGHSLGIVVLVRGHLGWCLVSIECHDLAKRLSHYLYFFSFLFLLDL